MNKKKIVLVVFLGIVLLAPLLVYGFSFGLGVWDDHDNWAKMGSALGGIYSPIFALATIAILFRQQRFSEVSYRETKHTEIQRTAHSNGERCITFAAQQWSKLDSDDQCKFVYLIQTYSEVECDHMREEIFEELNDKYSSQLVSLVRMSLHLYHMSNSEVNLQGAVYDLRAYATSLIDINVLIEFDLFYKKHSGDEAYAVFALSDEEIAYIDKSMDELRLRNRKSI